VFLVGRDVGRFIWFGDEVEGENDGALVGWIEGENDGALVGWIEGAFVIGDNIGLFNVGDFLLLGLKFFDEDGLVFAKVLFILVE